MNIGSIGNAFSQLSTQSLGGGSFPQIPGGGSNFGGGNSQQVGFSNQSDFQSGQSNRRPPLPPPELMADLGKALRIPPEQLAQKLMSGQSLTQVASSVGLSSSDLQSKISNFLSERLPNLTDDQRTKMAGGIINGQPPPPPRQLLGSQQ